ncbi:efflux RND transporter periplasmic adaptor subunit [Halochromatium salexigens]|uniref:Efflux transporter periplasmic adaptor subunit n=1 Tax=Halochromatium salexigens TaxID=49447 RepID=A0AAJ0UHF0_HALSE|nr:efflux RND transporter periplasmic adaptor subunit [Halochromatium salexigens]MBK5931542.1 efflux transporter periplasmic adaptor subunit [Halochromatium salexigens]
MILRSLLVILILALLGGGLALLKYQQIQESMAQLSQSQPPSTVTATEVQTTRWQPRLQAVGNVQSVQGVVVNNEVAGQVKRILFESGDQVTDGQALVQLDTEVDEAALVGLRASLNLARLQLERNQKLLRDRAVSQGDVDELNARVAESLAQVREKEALIRKKTILAPFDGQLGIRRVNLGQFLDAGSAIVELEAIDPVYVDYALPERQLSEIEVDQRVEVKVNAYPGRVFEGRIQAISPAVNRETRNIQVRALVPNPDRLLLPGMFAKIETLMAARDAVLTLPRQAITFNTYGDSVFVIEPSDDQQESGQNSKQDSGQASGLIVQRRQVKTGAVREQAVEILSGLEAGERVVLAGQVKLRNGASVKVVEDEDQVAPEKTEAAPPSENADADSEA